MVIGTNLEYVQAFNQRIILNMIRLNSPLSRADIARRTNLAVPTISNIVRELIQQGLVMEKQQRRGRLGKPPVDLEINPEGAYAVGLNLDRNHLSGVLVDLLGNVHQRAHIDLEAPTPDITIPLMCEVTRDLVAAQRIPYKRLWGAGVGLPGPLHVGNRTNVEATDLSAWSDVSVEDELGNSLELPIYLEKNANAAALGERWYGAGRTMNDFVYLFFGYYMGGGVIMGGQPHHGFTGFAGELGNIPIKLGDVPLGLKNLGDYTSPGLLLKSLRRQGVEVARPADLEALYDADHPAVLAWLEEAAQQLAPTLVVMEYLFDPEAFIFGGQLSRPLVGRMMEHLAVLIPPLRTWQKPYLPQLLHAETGEDAAALGAATLPIYDTLAPSPELLLKQAEKLIRSEG